MRLVTRLRHYLLPTEKQPPSDAEALSHKLMVRAGLVRQVGAGLWSWLPAGWVTNRSEQPPVTVVVSELWAASSVRLLPGGPLKSLDCLACTLHV